MSRIAYLNGEFLPIEEAKLSILDRGFLFGDGVYEAIPIYNGKLFRLQEHLDRLQRSLEGISISLDISLEEWDTILKGVMDPESTKQHSAYLQVTRGTMDARSHAWGPDIKPNVMAMCIDAFYQDQDLSTPGIKAITLDDIRWQYCHLKTLNLLPNVMLHQQARQNEAGEAILIKDGNAIEGSASNLFVVKDGIITTPPKGNYLLGGITREVIIELCEKNKIFVREAHISEDELHAADEVWVTASTKEIVPITTLNQHKVGKGTPGEMWNKVIRLYQAHKNEFMLS